MEMKSICWFLSCHWLWSWNSHFVYLSTMGMCLYWLTLLRETGFKSKSLLPQVTFQTWWGGEVFDYTWLKVAISVQCSSWNICVSVVRSGTCSYEMGGFDQGWSEMLTLFCSYCWFLRMNEILSFWESSWSICPWCQWVTPDDFTYTVL